jgi:hypothetical protein
VEKGPNPRQQLKIKIFEAYRNCISAPSPDILSKHKGQLWFLTDRWCKKYLFVKEWEKEAAEEMVVNISDVVERLIKEDMTIKVFDELDDFFMYLNRMLKNEMFRNLSKQLPKGVHREKTRQFFRINKLIEFKEREKERKLAENERLEIITDYMTKNEYTEIKNQLYHLSLDYEYSGGDEDNDINSLNFLNVKSVFNNDPENTNKFNVTPDDLREAVTYVLENKRQKRTRPCNRALFTVWCIKLATPGYLDKLTPVLDGELLNRYRESGIKPTLYETYLKHHPERKNSSKNSVESNASSDLDNFLDDLKIYLEENKS